MERKELEKVSDFPLGEENTAFAHKKYLKAQLKISKIDKKKFGKNIINKKPPIDLLLTLTSHVCPRGMFSLS